MRKYILDVVQRLAQVFSDSLSLDHGLVGRIQIVPRSGWAMTTVEVVIHNKKASLLTINQSMVLGDVIGFLVFVMCGGTVKAANFGTPPCYFGRGEMVIIL
jgi:hypothetical protein